MWMSRQGSPRSRRRECYAYDGAAAASAQLWGGDHGPNTRRIAAWPRPAASLGTKVDVLRSRRLIVDGGNANAHRHRGPPFLGHRRSWRAWAKKGKQCLIISWLSNIWWWIEWTPPSWNVLRHWTLVVDRHLLLAYRSISWGLPTVVRVGFTVHTALCAKLEGNMAGCHAWTISSTYCRVIIYIFLLDAAFQ